MPRKTTQKEFIEKAIAKHGDKYDYSSSEYKGSGKKVKIICKTHGMFEQTPREHIHRSGCMKCGRVKTSTARTSSTQDWLPKAIAKHGDKYDYSEVEYVGSNQKVKITCSFGHTFWQTSNYHLAGCGCPECLGTKKSNTANFTLEAIKIHGNIFDYSKVEYVGTDSKVEITCKNGHKFYQTPYHHLKGHGCLDCSGKKQDDTKSFIEKARLVHQGEFDYSQVKYVGCETKVEIVCSNLHRFLQLPSSHLQGHGCWECLVVSRRGETSPRWNPSRTDKERLYRREPQRIELNEWRKSVFGRDSSTCRCCRKKRGELNAHHILPWSKFPEVRFDVDNGITLCRPCHQKYHSAYKLAECNHKTIAEFLATN